MSVVLPQVNLVAIAVAAVVQFILGWLWYMPSMPTGRLWMRESGMTTPPAPSPKLALWLVHALIAAWVIAVVYTWAGGGGLAAGICIGLILAVPAATMEIAGGMTMNSRSAGFIAVQAGFALVGYGLMGAIIGALS